MARLKELLVITLPLEHENCQATRPVNDSTYNKPRDGPAHWQAGDFFDWT
jgi:hypothetical protein